MNEASWERLTDAIDIKLGVDRHGRTTQPLEDQPELEQKIEFFEFEQAGRPLRLERRTGPAIVDRKSHYSHRGGTANRIENIYDPSEIVHSVVLLEKQGDEWEEVDINSLSL